MKKIFIVTSGSYSDYGIDAVFDDRGLAENFIRRFEKNFWGGMDIEEWDLNPHEEPIKQGLFPYNIQMDKTGKVVGKLTVSSYDMRKTTPWQYSANGYFINSFCWAKDEQHAIKITNERRIQLLATNQWGV